ncbi:lactase-like protein isoform X6 [Mesocricetus auratus]|uniref:Lactase-like protein isoform X6 n=1 Tax=Mesocricetus auratus TaxID=10036 RepID=A0ABM2X1S2_MESAU|nr:lactase-like protein isoform X6 [Mesocricetus auratus]
MKPVRVLILGWILLVPRVGAARRGSTEEASFYYGTFPPGFSWGVGSSAYQTEGAWDQDGKGPSIWDAFTHGEKGTVLGDDTADAACDSYYKVQEDIALVKELHVSHYRFSLSWPRILPTGVRAVHVNKRGIKFYSDFIDALLQSNITPIVTLHHWDLPQMLQVTYGGWQNVNMTRYFREYADLCFEVFGDRVKHWLTFSDPRTMVEKGYETGLHAPGLRLQGTGLYMAAHHIIKTQYGDPLIYVTENGASQKLHCTQLCDEWRIQYLKGYINEMLKAIKDGVNIKGYTSWSLLDKFEWEKGYADRYGFYYVEFNVRNKPRYPKASVQYYKEIITANGFPNPREVESWHLKALETCSINNQMLATEPLLRHMHVASEIVVPTVCVLSILISALLLTLLLRSHG